MISVESGNGYVRDKTYCLITATVCVQVECLSKYVYENECKGMCVHMPGEAWMQTGWGMSE